jgi:hypothetical protein
MADTLDIAGISADEVFKTIRDKGISDSDAKLLVSNWIYQNYLTLHRTFAYVTAFPASVPSCVPAPFTRTFEHRDWVDGEDLVQATASANDEGFNARFHHIEVDLDALGAKIATLAQCMADMRASLRSMLDEIAAELNRIDSDIGAVKGPVIKPPIFTGGVLTAPVAPISVQVPTATLPGAASDPGVRYLGSTVFQDKTVSLFNTSQGIIMMPAVDATSPTTVDTRVGTAGAVWQATLDNADLKTATQQAVSKQDLVNRFGNLQLSNGQTLANALAVLPADAHYDNVQAMLTDLSSRTAGALQSTTGLSQQLAASVDAPTDATNFKSVDVSGLKDLSPDATTALRQAGLNTIGQLADADPAAVTKALEAAKLTAGQAAAIHGTAKTLAAMTIH